MNNPVNKILIIGAGNIGSSVAESLAKDNEITVVDQKSQNLSRLRNRIDARFLVGSADNLDVLERAGCEEADIILAVTESDMTNLSICHICNTLYNQDGTNTRISRIRNQTLANNITLLDAFGVTIAYNPENFVANSIANAVEHPGSTKVLECCGGSIKVAVVEIPAGNPWIGRTLTELYAQKPQLNFIVFAIKRNNLILRKDATVRFEVGDELLLVSLPDDLVAAIRRVHEEDATSVRVFVAGGGPIGEALASKLEHNFAVTLVEGNSERCAQLAQNLDTTLIHNADPTDAEVLKEEDIEQGHYFCAVTDTDEINIMSALLAKQLGCANSAVLVNRSAFLHVLREHGMDTVVSPAQITISMLKQLNKRSYITTQPLDEDGSTLTQFPVNPTSKIEGKKFNEIIWPDNIFPCALVRETKKNETQSQRRWRFAFDYGTAKPQIFFPDSDTTVAKNDLCLVFISDGNTEMLNKLADLEFNTF